MSGWVVGYGSFGPPGFGTGGFVGTPGFVPGNFGNATGGLGNGHWQAGQALYGYPIGTPHPIDAGAAAAAFANACYAAEQADREALRAVPNEGVRAGEVTAWRAWRIWLSPYGRRLQSFVCEDAWEPGKPMRGEVYEGGGAMPRHGVYALKDKEALEGIFCGYRQHDVAIGQVSLWGEIHEHEHGYRAEWAAVHSLELYPQHEMFDPPRPWKWWQLWRKRAQLDDKPRWVRQSHDERLQSMAQELGATYGVECTIAENVAGL